MTVWVIESRWAASIGKIEYARLLAYGSDGPKFEWTEDIHVAMQFAREVDAVWFAMLYPKECCACFIREHMFVDGVARRQEEGA